MDDATPASHKEAVLRTLATVDGDSRSVAIRCLATGSQEYRSAFVKLMAGQPGMWSDPEREAVTRAQSLTDAAGGFAVAVHARPDDGVDRYEVD